MKNTLAVVYTSFTYKALCAFDRCRKNFVTYIELQEFLGAMLRRFARNKKRRKKKTAHETIQAVSFSATNFVESLRPTVRGYKLPYIIKTTTKQIYIPFPAPGTLHRGIRNNLPTHHFPGSSRLHQTQAYPCPRPSPLLSLISHHSPPTGSAAPGKRVPGRRRRTRAQHFG